MIKYLKGKCWQIKIIVVKITKNVYYGIKWFLLHNPSSNYKEGDPITKHPDYERIIDNVNRLCKAGGIDNQIGITHIGELGIDKSKIPVPVFSDYEKKYMIHQESGMEWDDILKKAENDLNIKFTKPQKKAILKASIPNDFNSIKLKIKEIYEKKQNNKKKVKKVKKGK